MEPGREALLYKELSTLPRPQYPFSDFVNPHIESLASEYYQWIDTDCDFKSRHARDAYKRHRLSDIAARAFPALDLKELRPVARFTSCLAIIDDYLDKASLDELEAVCDKAANLLKGKLDREPSSPGFFRQVFWVRQDAMACGMPPHLYQQFVDAIVELMTGYGKEKRYNAADTPPRLMVYTALRRQTSGGVCYAKYLCMQKNYRLLPDYVLQHPVILRAHSLAGTLIGYHNDFISLPKELARGGDVVNLVMSVQREFRLGSLQEAWTRALAIHDEALDEFTFLLKNLPDFGDWQLMAAEYAADLGVMVQGVYAWHTQNNRRYVAGAYVEPLARPIWTGERLTRGAENGNGHKVTSTKLPTGYLEHARGQFQARHLVYVMLLLGGIFAVAVFFSFSRLETRVANSV